MNNLTNITNVMNNLNSTEFKIIELLSQLANTSLTEDESSKISEQLSIFDKELVSRLFCDLIKEKEIRICQMIFNSVSFEKLTKIINKTLGVYNSSIENNLFRNSIGGIFMKLVKVDSGLNKSQIKEIFCVDYKSRRNKRKVKKLVFKFENSLKLSC